MGHCHSASLENNHPHDTAAVMIEEFVHRSFPDSIYNQYHELMTMNKVDGRRLISLDDDQVADYINQIGVTDVHHRMAIAEELINIKNKISTTVSSSSNIAISYSEAGQYIMGGISQSLEAASTVVTTQLISRIVDLHQLVDQLTSFLPFDGFDDDIRQYKLMISDYSYLWMMLTRFMVKNSKNSLSAETIKHFDEKQILRVHTRVFYQLRSSSCHDEDDNDRVAVKVESDDPNSSSSFIPEKCVYLRFAMTDEDSGDLSSNRVKNQLFDDIRGMYDMEVLKGESMMELCYFESNQIGKQVGRDLFNHCMPTSEVQWPELQSDDAMTSLVFSGLGQVYLMRCSSSTKEYEKIWSFQSPVDAYYEVDLTFLGCYEVRRKYERYGSIAFFDKDRSLIAMYCTSKKQLVRPNDIDWMHVKAHFRSTMVATCTLREHLCHNHFIISNSFMLSTRQNLSSHHPIRRLLKPHFYNTADVNWNAQHMLIPTHGIAFKLFAFNEDAWRRAFIDCLRCYRYETFPTFIEAKGLSSDELATLPLATDGLDLWNVIKTYVTRYLSIFYRKGDTDHEDRSDGGDEDHGDSYDHNSGAVSNDAELVAYWQYFNNLQPGINTALPAAMTWNNVVDHLTHCIFHVTGGHELFGAIVEYLDDPSLMPAKLSPESDVADVQTYFLQMSLISLTGKKQPPLMSDWSHLHSKDVHGDKHEAVLQTLALFKRDLQELNEVIIQRNAVRSQTPRMNAFCSFLPTRLECSVSV